jgi:hypothetical protein
MSGKAAIAHHNYLHTWLIKFFCKPRQVEDQKDIVAAADLAFSIMPHIILYFFQDKMDKEAKRTSIVGKGATHLERML